MCAVNVELREQMKGELRPWISDSTLNITELRKGNKTLYNRLIKKAGTSGDIPNFLGISIVYSDGRIVYPDIDENQLEVKEFEIEETEVVEEDAQEVIESVEEEPVYEEIQSVENTEELTSEEERVTQDIPSNVIPLRRTPIEIGQLRSDVEKVVDVLMHSDMIFTPLDVTHKVREMNQAYERLTHSDIRPYSKVAIRGLKLQYGYTGYKISVVSEDERIQDELTTFLYIPEDKDIDHAIEEYDGKSKLAAEPR